MHGPGSAERLDFWLKEDLPEMGITKLEFTGLESKVKMSKGMLQFLLGDSGLDDSDACVAWLIDAKFGEPKFTWKWPNRPSLH